MISERLISSALRLHGRGPSTNYGFESRQVIVQRTMPDASTPLHKILIVEDDLKLARLMAGFLEQHGRNSAIPAQAGRLEFGALVIDRPSRLVSRFETPVFAAGALISSDCAFCARISP
jgi:hypothetical protein